MKSFILKSKEQYVAFEKLAFRMGCEWCVKGVTYGPHLIGLTFNVDIHNDGTNKLGIVGDGNILPFEDIIQYLLSLKSEQLKVKFDTIKNGQFFRFKGLRYRTEIESLIEVDQVYMKCNPGDAKSKSGTPINAARVDGEGLGAFGNDEMVTLIKGDIVYVR